MATSLVRRAAALAAGVMLALAAAPGLPASAAPAGPPEPVTKTSSLLRVERDGACNRDAAGNGEMCFWKFQNFGGSSIDLFHSTTSLNTLYYVTPKTGQGEPVGNNTQSLWNYDLIRGAYVFTGEYWGGVDAWIPPNDGGNHSAQFWREIESYRWVSAS